MLTRSTHNVARSICINRQLVSSGIFVTLALFIALIWGPFFDDAAYVTFRHAQSLASGKGLYNDPWGSAWPSSPLYVLVLSLPAWLGISLSPLSLVLSALGWGVTACIVYHTARITGHPVVAITAATLITFNPALILTLGTAIPWALALACLAVTASLNGRWKLQRGALILMLCTFISLPLLALAIILWLFQTPSASHNHPSWPVAGLKRIVKRLLPRWRRPSRAAYLIGYGLPLTLVVLVGISLYFSQAFLKPPLIDWRHKIWAFFPKNEYYYLSLPLLGLGLWSLPRKVSSTGLLWGITLFWGADLLTQGILALILPLLLALGIEWLVDKVKALDILHLDPRTLTVSLATLAALPWGSVQIDFLSHHYAQRPVALQKLELQASAWLREHTQPTDTLLASQHVGYLAHRPTLPWNGESAEPVELTKLLLALNQNPPQYCISLSSLPWQQLLRAGPFYETYVPSKRFTSPDEPSAPLTIWTYTLSSAQSQEQNTVQEKERQTLNVRLSEAVDCIGYHYWPHHIQPGEAVHVTLFLRATQPVSEGFRTILRLVSPADGQGWAQEIWAIPRSLPVAWWRPDQVIAERFVLTTTTKTPIGAHQLNFSITTPDLKTLLPLYRNEDTSPLDRVALGYVAVPWQGTTENLQPVAANFGDLIQLVGFEPLVKLTPGTEIEIKLVWQAQQAPQNDYIVFVHLLDAENRYVSGHDGAPMNGRYPTSAWRPQDLVPDTHRLMIPSPLPAGVYQLQVGLYDPHTQERLPVWDQTGAAQANHVMVLQSMPLEPAD